MKDNKGFSFVEIIIVIAILAVLATGAVISINTVGKSKTTKCAKKIDAELNSVRLDNMSKELSEDLVIYKDVVAGDYYMEILQKDSAGTTKSIKKEKVGSSSLSIKYNTAVSTVKDVNGTNKIVISYEKGTGKLKFSGDTVLSIQISGEGREHKIVFAQETGKHTFK